IWPPISPAAKRGQPTGEPSPLNSPATPARIDGVAHWEIANMITVFGEGRGFRVVWLLEEMGLAYKLRPVDLLAGVENDAEYLAINPPGSSLRSRMAMSRW